MRQTNVVWVLFLLGERCAETLASGGLLRRVTPATSIPAVIGRFRDTWDDFPGNIFSFVVQFFRHLPRLLSRHLSLFVAPVVFAVFLVLNKGVVLGKATDEVLHLNLRRG